MSLLEAAVDPAFKDFNLNVYYATEAKGEEICEAALSLLQMTEEDLLGRRFLDFLGNEGKVVKPTGSSVNLPSIFRLGTTEVTAYGAKPNVQLPKAGTWDGALTVRDASNNSIVQSFSVRVTGAGPAPLTQDMVLLAILIPMLSILAIALVQPRIWKHEGGDGLAPEHFGELRAHDIVVAEVAGADAPPFPFRPDRQTEEE